MNCGSQYKVLQCKGTGIITIHKNKGNCIPDFPKKSYQPEVLSLSTYLCRYIGKNLEKCIFLFTSFVHAIFCVITPLTEHLLTARHCVRCWGYQHR